jgi:hypothetical protein
VKTRNLPSVAFFVSIILTAAHPVWAQSSCATIFTDAISLAQESIPAKTLPQLVRSEIPNEVLANLSKFWGLQWKLSAMQYRGEPTAQIELELSKASEKAIESLSQFFAADPELIGLNQDDYLNAARRTLNWKLVTRNESVSRKGAIEMERYRLWLVKNDIDPNKSPNKWGPLFHQNGFEYIRHAGSIKNLMEILKIHKILPNSMLNTTSGMGGDKSFVYFELPEKIAFDERPTLMSDQTRGPYWNNIVLENGFAILLPVEAFDVFKWSHGNSFWEYGKLSESSLKPVNSTVGFLNMIHESESYTENNRFAEQFTSEWMFQEPIDLEKINFKILVHPSKKEQFIKEAYDVGIPKWIIDRIE